MYLERGNHATKHFLKIKISHVSIWNWIQKGQALEISKE